MANTGSQALQIRDLLVEKLELFDPTLETAEASPLYQQVIQPVVEALGTDLFDTDVDSFLRDRLRQEYPTLSVTDGEAIVDLLVKPIRLLLESSKRETQILRRGQSVRNAPTMRLEDAEGLAANFFVNRRKGGRATGTVRVFYAQPTFVAVLSTVSFSTGGGLRFFPIRPQIFTPDILLIQQSGTFYYVDVQVIAEESGSAYSIGAGEISQASGLAGAARVSNTAAFGVVTDEETAEELLARTGQSLTERSLNTRRGISARLLQDFPTLRNLEVVGYGDPEMRRDVLTGGGQGRIIASGTCFIVGQFCLMFSMYEDRGLHGELGISEGDEIEFNYWKFLYDVDPEDAHETFSVENILFDTRELFTENLPSVVLFQLSGTPSVLPPVAATLPGVLPGVFSVVRTKGILEISDIPGGILNPDSPRGTILVDDNEVHIGGHYDVWVRPSVDTQTVTDPGVARSEAAFFEGTDLYTSGGSLFFRNQFHREFYVEYTATLGDLRLGEPVEAPNGAIATIVKKTATHIWLSEFVDKVFNAGDVLTGRTTGATANITAIHSYDLQGAGYREGMLLAVVSGNDIGVYKILDLNGPLGYVDIELTATEGDLSFRILDEVTMEIFDPKELLLPFGAELAEDLRTVIGSTLIRLDTDLLKFGVVPGDSLEILEGDDQGVYTISSFDDTFGGKAPVLSAPMSGTAAGLGYRVYRSGTPLQTPLLRILPSGVTILDPSGQDSGSKVPYSLPVEGRALEAFGGAGATAYGRNGFVLSDPGKDWEPEGDLFCDPNDFAEANTCFSDECLSCANGYIACVTLLDDGRFYLDSQLPADAQQFLGDLYDWAKSIVENFGLGDDADAFIDGFHPFILGPPDTSVSNILYQAEICIPAEMFDGCTNVFVAIPEFDWRSEFEQMGIPAATEVITFAEALDKFNSGELEGSGNAPALMKAQAGSSLTILSGANAGSYIVDKVLNYKLCHGGAIQDEGSGAVLDLSKCYDISIAVIRGSFPVNPMAGVLEFFEDGVPPLNVPLPPTFNVECLELTTGNEVNPWEVFQLVLTWIFQWLNSMGFDLPSGVELDPGETLKALWQLFFTEYLVGEPTCEQYTRMSFVEPTSVTCFGAQACVGISYNEPQFVPAELVSELFTVPMVDLEGQTVTITYTDILGVKELTGVLDASVTTVTTVADLATVLQTLLDPLGSFVNIIGTFSPTGALSISTVKGANDLELTIDFPAQLGFYNDEKWASMYVSVPLTEARWRMSTAGLGSILFSWESDLGGPSSSNVTFAAGAYSMQDAADAIALQLTAAISGSLGGGSAALVTATLVGSGGEVVMSVRATISGGTDAWASPFILVVGAGTTGIDLYPVLFPNTFVSVDQNASSISIDNLEPKGIDRLRVNVDTSGTNEISVYSWGAGSNSWAEYVSTGMEAAYLNILDNPASATRYDDMAILLNSFDDLVQDTSGARHIYFVGGDRLEVRTLAGGSGVLLHVDQDTNPKGMSLLGFDAINAQGEQPITSVSVPGINVALETAGALGDNNDALGAVEPGDLIREVFIPPEPTLFSVVTGSAELLYAASGDVDPFQVFPGETTQGKVLPTALPRDIVVASDYAGATVNVLRFSDASLASPVQAGIDELSDTLWLYEHRAFLEFTIASVEENRASDRVIGITTSFGSNTVRLPRTPTAPDFNFLSSTTGDLFDEAQVGDLLFIEEGDDAGGYTITARSEFELELSAPLSGSTSPIFASGNDGNIEAETAVLTSESAVYTSDDIGRFMTIWAVNRDDYAGSFRITAVSDLGTHVEYTLDTGDFPDVEQEVHWAITRAPTEDPRGSAIGGRSELLAVRPIRIYSGVPSEHRVAQVSPHLDRTLSEIAVAHPLADPPRTGVLQPFQFIRSGVQHISSTAMKGQGRELGLYWFDVQALSLGGDTIHNIPEGTRMEPIFGTYLSEGYRLEVEDPNLVFSPQERSRMVMSTMVLPTGFEDTIANKVALDGRLLRVTYDYAPLVDQIQRLLTSESDRILCASPLVRHFMPSYVYLDLNISGGSSPQTIASGLIDSIQSLQPTDDLDVSKLEKVLHANSVIRYDHPVTALIVTHDLDRRLVGFRSVNKIGDDEIVFNGSNRTTYFIPGPDVSGVVDPETLSDGERILIESTLPVSTLR